MEKPRTLTQKQYNIYSENVIEEITDFLFAEFIPRKGEQYTSLIGEICAIIVPRTLMFMEMEIFDDEE